MSAEAPRNSKAQHIALRALRVRGTCLLMLRLLPTEYSVRSSPSRLMVWALMWRLCGSLLPKVPTTSRKEAISA